jgi:hypothetical protein
MRVRILFDENFKIASKRVLPVKMAIGTRWQIFILKFVGRGN